MMLRADPDDRPTTTDLLALPFVRKHVQLLLGTNADCVPTSPSGGTQLASAIKALSRLRPQSSRRGTLRAPDGTVRRTKRRTGARRSWFASHLAVEMHLCTH